MKKNGNSYRIVPSSFLLCALVFEEFFLVGVFFLVVFLPSSIKTSLWVYICSGVLLIGGALLLLLLGMRRFLVVVTIDENGISRAAFKKFYKLTMVWDEIYEIRYFESGLPFLLFSQTKSTQGLSYWKITKIKNLIQIQLTQKNYDLVKQYIKQPILGLTDAKKAQLKLRE